MPGICTVAGMFPRAPGISTSCGCGVRSSRNSAPAAHRASAATQPHNTIIAFRLLPRLMRASFIWWLFRTPIKPDTRPFVKGKGGYAAGGCGGGRSVSHTPPGFPVDVGAACTPPGDVAATRNIAGKANLHGGVKTPPYGTREQGGSDRRSQQDKIARAACRPPLQPNGNWEFLFWIRNSRKDAQTACPGRFSFSFRFSPVFHRGIFGGLSVFLTIFPRFAQGFPHFQQSFPHFPRGKGGGYGGKPGANGAKPMVFPGFFLSVKNSSQQVHLLGP